MTQEQQNNLAHLLAKKLFDATEKFVREHKFININGVIGAANIYLSTQYVNAPTKEIALQNLEEDFEIIRNMIRVTPDSFFGKGNMAKLN